jgi:hypothetical protein
MSPLLKSGPSNPDLKHWLNLRHCQLTQAKFYLPFPSLRLSAISFVGKILLVFADDWKLLSKVDFVNPFIFLYSSLRLFLSKEKGSFNGGRRHRLTFFFNLETTVFIDLSL